MGDAYPDASRRRETAKIDELNPIERIMKKKWMFIAPYGGITGDIAFCMLWGRGVKNSHYGSSNGEISKDP